MLRFAVEQDVIYHLSTCTDVLYRQTNKRKTTKKHAQDALHLN